MAFWLISRYDTVETEKVKVWELRNTEPTSEISKTPHCVRSHLITLKKMQCALEHTANTAETKSVSCYMLRIQIENMSRKKWHCQVLFRVDAAPVMLLLEANRNAYMNINGVGKKNVLLMLFLK